jgi:hypothetical protein
LPNKRFQFGFTLRMISVHAAHDKTQVPGWRGTWVFSVVSSAAAAPGARGHDAYSGYARWCAQPRQTHSQLAMRTQAGHRHWQYPSGPKCGRTCAISLLP